jgi:indolepyruvate ferredoxin oxidoreductase beta subunit
MVPTGAADYLLSFEKLEACRWLHYLRPNGVVVVNDEAIPTLALESRTPYPDDESIVNLLAGQASEVRLVPAGRLATRLGNPRVANVILLGTLSRFVDVPVEAWYRAIEERVPPKFRELNRRAFELGRAESG